MIKKKFLTIFSCVLALSLLSCDFKKDGNNKEAEITPTQIVIEEDEEIIGEPTLSEEALNVMQFKMPQQGDIIADIIVEGYGDIRVKLFSSKAPLAVENFTVLAKEGYYNGISFHLVLNHFMIQGGDPDGNGSGGESIWGKYFKDEINDELYLYRGALAMANKGPDTNSSQFFLVQADVKSVRELSYLLEEGKKLTLKEYLLKQYGIELSDKLIENYMRYGGAPWLTGRHTVFGQIIEGFEVLDAIAGVPVDAKTSMPLEPVIIKEIIISEWK